MSSSCPCGGKFYATTNPKSAGEHYVWVAFLNYENDEYRKEEWGRDYTFLPTNKLTCWLSSSTIFHCQMFFWSETEQTFVTISVDAYQQRVFRSTQKEFRHGWTFVELQVSHDEELAMYNFLSEQMRQQRPFNTVGAYALFFCPIATDGQSWFCSQLDVAALQHAGMLRDVQPHATSPADLHRLLLQQLMCTEISTPVQFKRATARLWAATS